MKGDKIYYRKGFKYQLVKCYSVLTKIIGFIAKTPYLELTSNGVLTINKGYAWDGASGPTIDTKSSMRGSLVHDAGYQLLRLELIPQSTRPLWDDELHDITVEDGMWHWRAEGWEEVVSHLAAGAARAGSEPEILEAP
jgi:hypothetical protein